MVIEITYTAKENQPDTTVLKNTKPQNEKRDNLKPLLIPKELSPR